MSSKPLYQTHFCRRSKEGHHWGLRYKDVFPSSLYIYLKKNWVHHKKKLAYSPRSDPASIHSPQLNTPPHHQHHTRNHQLLPATRSGATTGFSWRCTLRRRRRGCGCWLWWRSALLLVFGCVCVCGLWIWLLFFGSGAKVDYELYMVRVVCGGYGLDGRWGWGI